MTKPALALLLALASQTLSLQSSATTPASSDSLGGHWEGNATQNNQSFRLALDYDPAITSKVMVDYSDLPLFAVPFDLTGENGATNVERHAANGAVSKLDGAIADGKFSGTFKGAGANDAHFELTRVSPGARILREEDVHFANGDVKLAGTIIFPDGTPPYPAVVITHGSDPDTREAASYRSRGTLYARHGVAALIYDKRGTGESTGDYTTSGIDDLAKDAIAGVNLLKARSDIACSRIGVAGFSQGGWIAPLAATLSGDVAFVSVQSAAGIGPMAQSLYHNANEMRAAGAAEADIARAQDLRRRLYAGVRKRAFDNQLSADLAAASSAPWFAASKLPKTLEPVSDGERRLLMFEPLPVWREVHVPVQAIWGERDVNLPALDSREQIVMALAGGGNRDFETHTLPGLGHGLFRTRNPGAPWDFVRGSDELEPLIADWLQREVVRNQVR